MTKEQRMLLMEKLYEALRLRREAGEVLRGLEGCVLQALAMVRAVPVKKRKKRRRPSRLRERPPAVSPLRSPPA